MSKLKMYFSLLTLIGLIFSSGPSFAAKTLGWHDLLKATKENSLQLRSQFYLNDSASADHKRAWGGFLPSLNLEGQRSKNELKTSGATSDYDQDVISARLSLPLFKGFATVADFKKTRTEYEKTQENSRLSEADIRYQLRLSLSQHQLSLERQKVYKRLLDKQKLNMDLLKLKYNSGSEARWGFKQAKAELQTYEWRLEELKRQEALALEQLATLTGLKTSELSLRVSLGDLLKVSTQPQAISHPRLRFRELQVESAAQDVVTARSQFFPQIEAFYAYENLVPTPGTEKTQESYGLGLKWNLFDGFSNFYEVSKAKAYKMALEADLEFDRRKVETDLKEAQSRVEMLQERMPIFEDALNAARERQQTVNEQYKAGLRSYLDWEQSQGKLIRSEEDLLLGTEDLLSAIADYERKQGLGL